MKDTREQPVKSNGGSIIPIIIIAISILAGAALAFIFLFKNYWNPQDRSFTYKDPSGITITEHNKSGNSIYSDSPDKDLKITVVGKIVYCSDGRTYERFGSMDGDELNCTFNSDSTAAVISDSKSSYYIDTDLRPVLITDNIQYGGFKLSPDGEKVLFADRTNNTFIMFYPHREAYYYIELDDELEVETFASDTVVSPTFESVAFSTERGTTILNFETSVVFFSKVEYEPIAITDDGKMGFFELYDKKELYYYHDGQMDMIGKTDVSEHYYINRDCTEIMYYDWNEDAIWYFRSGMNESEMLLNHKPSGMFTSDFGEIETSGAFKNHLDVDSFSSLFILAYKGDFYYFPDLRSEPVVVKYSELEDDQFAVNVTDNGVEMIYVYEGSVSHMSTVNHELYSLHITKDGYSKKRINEDKREYISGYAVSRDFSIVYVRAIDHSKDEAVIRKYSNGESYDLEYADDYRDVRFTYSHVTGKLYYCMDGTLYSISDGDNTSVQECDNAKEIATTHNHDAFPNFRDSNENPYAYVYGNVVKLRR